MKPITTRTIGPLHLEDLEPHRFEDLARQLLYDFRRWNELEATGRGGSDDGFDARGIEGRNFHSVAEVDDSDDGDEELPPMEENGEERVWLVQCKREKKIGPAKLIGYLDDIPEAELGSLYGIVFIAACDFSKTARDGFKEKARELGFAEAHLWGKGEVEDQLFQPKNDHLLFGYFGFSLKTRARSQRTAVRSKLAIKRKLKKKIGKYEAFVILDAGDDRFPYLEENEALSRYERGRWTVVKIFGFHHEGMEVLVGRGVAIYRPDGTWDYAEKMNDAKPRGYQNPWQPHDEFQQARSEAMKIWDAAPESEKGWFEVVSILPYVWIVDIDDDSEIREPLKLVYVDRFDLEIGPIDGRYRRIATLNGLGQQTDADPEKRVEIFARKTNEERAV